VVAPSNGKVHNSGKPYKMVRGSVGTITTLTAQERDAIFDLARTFDTLVKKDSTPRKAREKSTEHHEGDKSATGDRPGDLFNALVKWEDLLKHFGWNFAFEVYEYCPQSSEWACNYQTDADCPGHYVKHWTRPGKEDGTSATTNFYGGDRMYVWTTSTTLDSQRAYDKIGVYAAYDFEGDVGAASRHLPEFGFLDYKPEQFVSPATFSFKFTGASKKSESFAPDKKLLDFGPTDEGNALAFMYLYQNEFLYCKAYGWLTWTNKQWSMEMAEARLDKRMVDTLKMRGITALKYYEMNIAKEILKVVPQNSGRIAALKDRLDGKFEVPTEIFDSNPDLLNCANGVVNLRTGELFPHSPDQRFTYVTKINYNPEASPKAWLDFLEQVVGKWESVKHFLKMAVGYSLTGHTKEECLFYLYGPTRSGKGTFSEIIMEMLGDILSIEVDFNTFTSKRENDSSNFDLAPLKPARLIFASESQRHQALNTAKIKTLTGGNKVRCCYKHKDHFTYRPQFKMWMSSNWAVNGDVDDDALWGRLRVIDFPNSYLGKEDKHLKDKLKSPEVLEGILAWAVQGSIEWYASETGLSTPKTIKETTKKQRDEGDFVQTWLDECTEKDETIWVANADLMHSYKRWCDGNGVEAKQMKSLITSLKVKGYLTNVLKREGASISRGVQGVKIL